MFLKIKFSGDLWKVFYSRIFLSYSLTIVTDARGYHCTEMESEDYKLLVVLQIQP